jgi:flagellar protein FlbD
MMIQLTRLNHIPLILNSDLIEHIEVTPDTVITLTTGQRFLVLESADEVVGKVVSFRRSILSAGGCPVLERAMPAVVEDETELGEVTKAHGR